MNSFEGNNNDVNAILNCMKLFYSNNYKIVGIESGVEYIPHNISYF